MKDVAIENARKRTFGASFWADGDTDGMTIGVAKNHVAIAFNQTTYNQNQIVVLQQRDALLLFALLLRAGKKEGWIE